MEIFKYIFWIGAASIAVGLLFMLIDTIRQTYKLDDDDENYE